VLLSRHAQLRLRFGRAVLGKRDDATCPRTFSDLLEEAQTRKLLTLEPDQKSGGYVIRRL